MLPYLGLTVTVPQDDDSVGAPPPKRSREPEPDQASQQVQFFFFDADDFVPDSLMETPERRLQIGLQENDPLTTAAAAMLELPSLGALDVPLLPAEPPDMSDLGDLPDFEEIRDSLELPRSPHEDPERTETLPRRMSGNSSIGQAIRNLQPDFDTALSTAASTGTAIGAARSALPRAPTPASVKKGSGGSDSVQKPNHSL